MSNVFRSLSLIVTVLGLVGGAPGGETPRVADSSAAGAGRFFHNSVPPSKQNRLVDSSELAACKTLEIWGTGPRDVISLSLSLGN